MWSILKMELYKVRKRPFLILFLLIPILAFIQELIFIENTVYRIDLYVDFFKTTRNTAILYYYVQTVMALSFPLFIMLIYTQVAAELKNGRQNSTFTLPYNKLTLYNSKIVVMIIYITAYVLILGIMSFVQAIVFDGDRTVPILALFYIWSAYLMILMVQYFIALFTKRFVLYMILFILIFFSQVAIKESYRMFVPYYYNTLSLDILLAKRSYADQLYMIPIYMVLFYTLGYFAFKRISYGKDK